jgi:hypothetical protein
MPPVPPVPTPIAESTERHSLTEALCIRPLVRISVERVECINHQPRRASQRAKWAKRKESGWERKAQ